MRSYFLCRRISGKLSQTIFLLRKKKKNRASLLRSTPFLSKFCQKQSVSQRPLLFSRDIFCFPAVAYVPLAKALPCTAETYPRVICSALVPVTVPHVIPSMGWTPLSRFFYRCCPLDAIINHRLARLHS